MIYFTYTLIVLLTLSTTYRLLSTMLKKYRVVEENDRFYPQHRFLLFFWKYYYKTVPLYYPKREGDDSSKMIIYRRGSPQYISAIYSFKNFNDTLDFIEKQKQTPKYSYL